MNFCDLLFNLVLMKQRIFAAIQLKFTGLTRHHEFQELFGSVMSLLVIDDHTVDVARQNVANRPNDHVIFFVDVDRPRFILNPFGDHLPKPQQVREVSRKLAS